MDLARIMVTTGGMALSGLVIWYFFFAPKGGARAVAAEGVQEALIVVKGGYNPDVIVVKAGMPVRLNFNRQETASCTEMVLLPDFNKSAKLPTGETVPIEFTPEEPGEYEFACQMGMVRGKLIVE
ncbi:MAG: cupredoxin domain-containing protein [Anaerolineae bacterium]